MTRRHLAIPVLVVAALAAAAPPASAQGDVPDIARGEFDARYTVVGSGAVERRRWKLSPSCLGRDCSSIRVRIRRPDGDFDAATLQRDGETYRGRVRTRAVCRGHIARRAAVMSIAIRVTRTSQRRLVSGRATVITGVGGELRLRPAAVGCPSGSAFGRLVRVTAKRVDLPAALRPKFTLNRPAPSISAGTTIVRFTDRSPTDDDIRSWSWTFGDPASGAKNRGSGPSVAHEYTVVGSYKVTLTVTDSSGQVASVSKTVVVSP